MFYKSFWISNSNMATYKYFFRCSKTSLCNILMVFFFFFLTPYTMGGHNFFHSIALLTIFNAPYASIGGVQVLFGH
jgi:hypothetical protein